MAGRVRDQRTESHTEDLEAAKAFFLLTEMMQARLAAVAAQHDMSHQQAHLLYLAGEGASMRELSERLGCDPSNVTGLADRLEQRGLVERCRSEVDRRVTELVRTDAGSDLVAGVQDEIFADLPIYRGLSTDERRQLQALLAKVVAHHDDLPELRPFDRQRC